MTADPRLPALLLRGLLAGVLLASATQAAAADFSSCADCHAKDGASTESDVPVIAGQSAAYFNDTMLAYRAGERPCPESKYRAGDTARAPTDMCKIAKAMSDAEIQQAAEHFAALPFVRAKQTVDPAKAATGRKLHELHCEKCHADGGSSKDDDSGILAGQWIAYLEHSMKEFIDGSRPMPKKMKPKVEPLSADDIKALLQFYGSQQ